ncbi:hypothetical protein DPMN_155495 [Dreissena polymorpha]|uniref:Uncharacterized protein n=1 Tax=Dreissena polymorpha TaxID=45954 RepID=A0A9D4FMZ3_DREPO|nr:hypothetical protein DPMN_155495 [Dreissena polymorpha]
MTPQQLGLTLTPQRPSGDTLGTGQVARLQKQMEEALLQEDFLSPKFFSTFPVLEKEEEKEIQEHILYC